MPPVSERQRSYMIAIARALNITINWHNIRNLVDASAWLSKYVPIYNEFKKTGERRLNMNNEELKKGTKLFIVDTSGHSFTLDSIVTVDRISDDGSLYAKDDNGYGQYLVPDNYIIWDSKEDVLEENPDFIEHKPSFDEIYSGSYKAGSCEPARISASVAPKRSRSKTKAVACPKVS